MTPFVPPAKLPPSKLCTLEHWLTLPAYDQGFTLYLEKTLPGSELASQRNPHRKHSLEWEAFNRGTYRAMMMHGGEEAGDGN